MFVGGIASVEPSLGRGYGVGIVPGAGVASASPCVEALVGFGCACGAKLWKIWGIGKEG